MGEQGLLEFSSLPPHGGSGHHFTNPRYTSSVRNQENARTYTYVTYVRMIRVDTILNLECLRINACELEGCLRFFIQFSSCGICAGVDLDGGYARIYEHKKCRNQFAHSLRHGLSVFVLILPAEHLNLDCFTILSKGCFDPKSDWEGIELLHSYKTKTWTHRQPFLHTWVNTIPSDCI